MKLSRIVSNKPVWLAAHWWLLPVTVVLLGAEKNYISSVYFHTIFMFSITKNRKYELKQGDRPIDVGDYLKDVFSSYYGEFLLNFGSEQLMASLAE